MNFIAAIVELAADKTKIGAIVIGIGSMIIDIAEDYEISSNPWNPQLQSMERNEIFHLALTIRFVFK